MTHQPASLQPGTSASPSGSAFVCWRLVQGTITVWVAVALVVLGSLTTGAWLRGGHVTPEHWAYHSALEQRGIPHHHGVVHTHPAFVPHVHTPHDPPTDLAHAHEVGTATILALLPTTMNLVMAPLSMSAVPDTGWHLLVAGSDALSTPTIVRSLSPHDPPLGTGIIPPPPEKPPARSS